MKLMKLMTLTMLVVIGMVLSACEQKREPVKQEAAEGKKQSTVKEQAPKPDYAFTLENYDGEEVSLSDYDGKIVVLEWLNPRCPYVVRHYEEDTMTDLAKKYADKGVVWLAIDSSNYTTNEALKQWAEQYEIAYPLLNDSTGKVGRQYGAKTTPHLFILDKDGTLVYEGAIDSQPATKGPVKEDTVNFVDKALQELLAGEEVTMSETKPYGCSVKYKE